MRPKIPLAQRISKHTGVSLEDVQCTFESPRAPTTGPCWNWEGTVNGNSPVVNVGGRMITVRRAIYELVSGAPIPADIRLSAGCTRMFCVNPNHTLEQKIHKGVAWQFEGGEPAIDYDADPIEDVVAFLYEVGAPYDIEALASASGYHPDQLREAAAGIEAGTW